MRTTRKFKRPPEEHHPKMAGAAKSSLPALVRRLSPPLFLILLQSLILLFALILSVQPVAAEKFNLQTLDFPDPGQITVQKYFTLKAHDAFQTKLMTFMSKASSADAANQTPAGMNNNIEPGLSTQAI
jgi:hypothetical protein